MKYSKFCRSGQEPVIEKVMIPTRRGNIFCKKIYYPASKNNDPMIALHGGPGVPHSYLSPLHAAIKKTPLILYDQIGCGESENPPLEDAMLSMDYFVEELESVKDHFGVKKFHLYGHSWGAAICLAYVLQPGNAQNVNSLILASPLISVPQWSRDSFRLVEGLSEKSKAAIKHLESRNIYSGPDFAEISQEYGEKYLCRIKPWPQPLVEALQGASADMRIRLWGNQGIRYPNGIFKDLDYSNRLHELNLPVLITAGHFDSAMPDTLLEYSRHIKDVTLKILEDISHMPHLENPKTYGLVLAEFIDMHTKDIDFKYRCKI